MYNNPSIVLDQHRFCLFDFIFTNHSSLYSRFFYTVVWTDYPLYTLSDVHTIIFVTTTKDIDIEHDIDGLYHTDRLGQKLHFEFQFGVSSGGNFLFENIISRRTVNKQYVGLIADLRRSHSISSRAIYFIIISFQLEC